jgi:FdhE protein
MMAIDSGLQDLKRQHPEWEPWLAVLQVMLGEIGDSKWDASVPVEVRSQQGTGKVPLLAGAALKLHPSSVGPMFERMVRVASRSGTAEMATLQAIAYAKLDVLAIFRASLNHDRQCMKEMASDVGANPEAFHAVGALISIPFLQACNRVLARSIALSWTEGYCPLCGAWPAFAEVRGIERSRYFRCGRCGIQWQAHCLFCPYCSMTDHKELASLVPEQNGGKSVIDACNRCLGYVKTLTKLQGSPPAKVMVEDLASVDLDIAALEQGYRRPEGLGYSLNAIVGSKAMPSKTFFSWGS